MSVSQVVTYNSRTDSGKSLSDTIEVDGDQAILVGPASVATGVSNQLYAIAFAVAKVVGFYLRSNCDLTIKTNSSGSPDNTINLKAGVPYVWQTGMYTSNPFTVDVTAWYLTNASGQQARLEGHIVKTT